MPRQRQRQNPNPTITNFIHSEDDPWSPRNFASSSALPHAEQHQEVSYHGDPRSDVGTSLLREGTETTANDSLAACTNDTSSLTSNSPSSAMGIRQLDQRLRLLQHDNHGVLGVSDEPSILDDRDIGRRPVLECPFNLLKCFKHFSVFEDWVSHSLDHFNTASRFRRFVGPPTMNRCCFCDETFEDPNGKYCWQKRMMHVSHHHRLGHSLSTARPDFHLYDYLWHQGLINREEYGDIKGNSRNRIRSLQNVGTLQNSPAEPARVFAIVNERRGRARR